MKPDRSPNPRRALLWKEWREQRWRGFLSAIVLMTLAGGLIRAQLLTLPEATVLVFGPASLLLAIFLSMGAVATEREDNTWPFLISQPMSRRMLLRAKWLMSAAILTATFLLAALTALWAASSRGLFELHVLSNQLLSESSFHFYGSGPFALLWTITVCLAASLALHAVLLVLLSRARTELHAGIGGILLAIVAVAWFLQNAAASIALPGGHAAWQPIFRITFILSPLSPLCFFDSPAPLAFVALAVAAAWVIAAVIWIDRFAGEGT